MAGSRRSPRKSSIEWMIVRSTGEPVYRCQFRPEADRVFDLLTDLCPTEHFSLLHAVVHIPEAD
ncbi:hypothetical protein [Sigmofec virus UA08Rod_5712]|uniref:Uncharacterized protein n=1 Tax=Sigmofec virus UA08Rod_5712 TaxID=2929438 RepID=A0A976R8J2_9VIRU|nr:hypothetical protein [Sigmofec virus UA08Rod_5712]